MTSTTPSIDIYAPHPNQTISSTTNPFTPSYVVSSLPLSSNPSALYASRIKNRLMLLQNPPRQSNTKSKTALKNERIKEHKKRRAVNLLSGGGVRKSLTRLKPFDEKRMTYALLIPLHQLWMGYISELLNLPRGSVPSSIATDHYQQHLQSLIPLSSSVHPKLIKADLTGCLLAVKASKNPCLIGLNGIVIYESEGAFRVVTEDNRIKLIPKQNTVFSLPIPLFSTLPEDHKEGMPFPLPPTLPSSTPLPPSPSSLSESPSQSPPHSPPPPLPTVLTSPHLIYTLYANQFRFRSAERAGRKFKAKESVEL